MKVYVVGKNKLVSNFIENVKLVDDIRDSDLVLFTGGEDVSPDIYKEKKYKFTQNNVARDNFEIQQYQTALANNKPMVGICRGAQFLTVMAGGKLIQHVTGQNYLHKIKDIVFDDEIEVTSTHHQMCYPFNLSNSKYKILGYAVGLNKEIKGTPSIYNPTVIEPEIIYYKEINALAIQGHPEYVDASKEFVNRSNFYIDSLVENYINNF